ncbi:MAG: DMT family transporter [Rhizobiaceae bacterium]|nr:MAG: DMT family transporter [Rhizobiaceae bacterium]CAG0952171.1 Riboflavin transporter [Rhizobiaceae bacterium]
MILDRPLLGVLLTVVFCAVAPIGDSIAKILGGTIPLLELLAVRFTAQTVLLVPLLVALGKPIALPRGVLGLAALRTALQLGGIAAMFASLRYLPLADAVAIAFVMPFILLLLGRYVLDEQVGPQRIAACVVGFVGTLLVIQPSFAEVGTPALLPFIVAIVFALYMLVSRRIAKDADPLALQAMSGLMATPVLVVGLLLGWSAGWPGFEVKLPDMSEAMLLATLGVIGTFAHLLMTWSLRFAPAATLAPIQYLEIPFATVAGFIIFGDLPNGLAALGIVITVAAGLYVVYRERREAEVVPAEV